MGVVPVLTKFLFFFWCLVFDGSEKCRGFMHFCVCLIFVVVDFCFFCTWVHIRLFFPG